MSPLGVFGRCEIWQACTDKSLGFAPSDSRHLRNGQMMTDGDRPTPAEQATYEAPAAQAADIASEPPAATDMGDDQRDRTAQDQRRRTVPYGALAEERARRKELQRELQTSIEGRQRLQGRLDVLHQLARQEGVAPGFDDEAMAQHTLSREATPSDQDSVTATDEAETQAEAGFRTELMHSVRDFVRDRPDFLNAYQHARQARVSELLALGYAPQEALGITFDNELEVIRNAYATGRNPAQVIYDYARQRGFGAAPAHDQSVGDGGHRPVMTEAEKVALAARGQASSKSLSTAGGGSTGTLTLEALAGMSDEEFAEATKGDRWQKLLK